ncbi:hypothetical protein CEUSTIGMA_g5431.t1 [Chlamydomonas eustigma]|uniref:Uncharacterized protein n=1 Tax=Chlamydomonas eustigma TaxID=1157962 RepID=A0A250X4Z5_9CHLO|nr:hypothetical protein CEUSTIGMA_g5431.t1 [Chlamydomonas eustigma]|eukprot:GAX77989.1 hypothetical protein CEUSTIGMA_g5431.t1 [Chlamydomonas eustigma]
MIKQVTLLGLKKWREGMLPGTLLGGSRSKAELLKRERKLAKLELDHNIDPTECWSPDGIHAEDYRRGLEKLKDIEVNRYHSRIEELVLYIKHKFTQRQDAGISGRDSKKLQNQMKRKRIAVYLMLILQGKESKWNCLS